MSGSTKQPIRTRLRVLSSSERQADDPHRSTRRPQPVKRYPPAPPQQRQPPAPAPPVPGGETPAGPGQGSRKPDARPDGWVAKLVPFVAAFTGVVSVLSALQQLATLPPVPLAGLAALVALSTAVLGCLARKLRTRKAERWLLATAAIAMAAAVGLVLVADGHEESPTGSSDQEPAATATPTPVPGEQADPPGASPKKSEQGANVVSIGPNPRELTASAAAVYGIVDPGIVVFDPGNPSAAPRLIDLPGRAWATDVAVGGGRIAVELKTWVRFYEKDGRTQFRRPQELSYRAGVLARTGNGTFYGDTARSKLRWVPDRGSLGPPIDIPGPPNSIVPEGDRAAWVAGETATRKGYISYVPREGVREDYELREEPGSVLVDDLRGILWASQPGQESIVCLSIATKTPSGPRSAASARASTPSCASTARCSPSTGEEEAAPAAAGSQQARQRARRARGHHAGGGAPRRPVRRRTRRQYDPPAGQDGPGPATDGDEIRRLCAAEDRARRVATARGAGAEKVRRAW